MINQQLSNYAKEQLQQGKNKEKVKSELLGAGWQETDINQALGIHSSSQLPRPPSPIPTPPFTSTDLQRLDTRAVWLFFFRQVFLFIFVAIWIGFGFITMIANTITGALGLALLVLLVALVFAFIWSKLTYHFYRYELTEEGFRKELGVIIKKYVTIPYDRIQNVDIHRGIIDRILGLSDVKIQTAGTNATEGSLPGLSIEIAEKLRNDLIHRAHQTRNRGV